MESGFWFVLLLLPKVNKQSNSQSLSLCWTIQTVTFRSCIAKKKEYNHKETEEQLDQITQASILLSKDGESSTINTKTNER
jgi:hypothetical protein